MRPLTCLLLFLFVGTSFPAQEYVRLLDVSSSNVNDIRSAFDEYWEGREVEKGKGFKQFKRWEYFMVPRVYPSGEPFAPDAAQKAIDRAALEISNGSRSSSGAWEYIGNESIPTGGGGSGRINSIRVHPEDPLRLFACAPAGGLWTSNDGGGSWSTTTDQLEHIGTSDVLIDPDDPQIMYLATGDSDGYDTYSIGVLKSTDGGLSWEATGLNWAFQQARRIHRMAMHPEDSDILFAATSNGLLRSTDAGLNWNSVAGGSFKDIEFHPIDHNIMYASGGSFFRSIDHGESFDLIDGGLPNGIGRMAIGVSPDAPDDVYLLCGDGDNSGFRGLYRSTDVGLSFSLRSSSPNLLGYDVNGNDVHGQAWWDLAIAVDPADADRLFVGGVNVWSSDDGGMNWSISSHWYGASGTPYVHADIHALEFLNGQLYVGCDGGVFKRSAISNSYTDLSAGLDIAQLYDLGTSATDPDIVITGWQDNGTHVKEGNSWDRVIGGDGMECMIDPTDASVMYGTLYYGNIKKSTNGGASFVNIAYSSGSGVDSQGNWVTPYVLDPQDHNTLYVGKDNIYKSVNAGSSWSVLNTPSSTNLNALAIAPTTSQRIYCSHESTIYRSTDGGASFEDISEGLPFGYITDIAVSDTDEDHLFITYSGFYLDEKVFESMDGGDSWSNISSGLPNVPVNTIVYEHGSNEGLYVGTDIGVYYRNATHSDWLAFFDGMPNVIVNELEIDYTSSRLVAATYGRGLWRSDLHSSAGCASDVNGDGSSDILDFLFLNSAYGQTCSGCVEDLDSSGTVDINDFLLFNSEFGSDCD